jgi:hypothetical protein
VWKDYVNNLKYFGKDTANPKYVCPKDLQKEHQKYFDKKTNSIYEEDNERYKKRIQKWLGLIVSDGDINVSVIKDLPQMRHEGNLLSHCVFKNEYFKKQNSLILSAKKEDRVLETIELNLEEKRIAQARGYKNDPSEYHKEIVALVNKNIQKIVSVGV